MAFSPETEKDISLIQVNSIWKSFKTGDHNTSILKNISTRIKPGEFVILFGPSGCGKSTLLNTLMGLEHPDKGDINFMGMKIWELDSDDRAVIRKKNIGIIYQQQNWVKSLNVIDNVALIGTLLGKSRLESREIAKEKLEIVGMLHRAEYKPYELSSGEQQRISLARSLMSNPALLIADEPTGNLDVKTGIKVMNIFKKLAEDGKTILMVTHNIESLDYADRILFMLDGQIRKDIEVKNEDINYIKTQINKDLEAFIQEIQDDKKDEQVKAPEPVPYKDYITKKRFNLKNFVESFWYNFVFLISMILLFSLFLPVYFVEYILFKKYVLSEKIKKFIMKVFNLLENRKKKINNSISSWDLGQISLGHLMEKKSRTLITVLGMGIGIGFITFLLSIGYGIENLVINEMLRIEEMRQVLVSPIVSSEIILDDEKLNLIKSVDGVKEIYPLISVATTIFMLTHRWMS
jgi:putative ABC transport system ATP-binding protein